MITRLSDGAVIFSSEDLVPVGMNENAGMRGPSLRSRKDHGMIYFNQRIYHSAPGEHLEGVRSHAVDIILSQNKMGAHLGSITVLECVDEKLRQNFISAMARWDPVDLIKKLKEQPRDDIDHPIAEKLPTPFMSYYDRMPDPEGQSAKCELFRAIRAYQRNHVEPPQALSSKGVSCGNFIVYSFKAAIVEELFPDGLPNEIAQKMVQIDEARRKNKAARKSEQAVEPMKLSDISEHYPYLDELLQLIEKHISVSQRRHVEFLQIPVKGTGVHQFFEQALTFPEFWQAGGVMFGYSDKDINVPYVMDYAAYQAVRQPDIANKKITALLLPAQRVEDAVQPLKSQAALKEEKDMKSSGTITGSSTLFNIKYGEDKGSEDAANSPTPAEGRKLDNK